MFTVSCLFFSSAQLDLRPWNTGRTRQAPWSLETLVSLLPIVVSAALPLHRGDAAYLLELRSIDRLSISQTNFNTHSIYSTHTHVFFWTVFHFFHFGEIKKHWTLKILLFCSTLTVLPIKTKRWQGLKYVEKYKLLRKTDVARYCIIFILEWVSSIIFIFL